MNHTSSKNPQIQKLLEKCHELLAYKEIALFAVVSGAHFTFGDDIDCNTCPHLGVPRVESHLFTVGGFLGNSKGMAWKTESMQNMGV